MALNSEQIGTSLAPMLEGSDDVVSSPAELKSVVARTSWREMGIVGPNAQSAGNSKMVGVPPVAAKQSLLLGSLSTSARPLVDLTLDSSYPGSRLMTMEFPFSVPIFVGMGNKARFSEMD